MCTKAYSFRRGVVERLPIFIGYICCQGSLANIKMDDLLLSKQYYMYFALCYGIILEGGFVFQLYFSFSLTQYVCHAVVLLIL